jgi:hypothetical protein
MNDKDNQVETIVEELSLDLDISEDSVTIGSETDDIIVPCFLINNVVFEEELEYLLVPEDVVNGTVAGDGGDIIPVYYRDGNGVELLGWMHPTTDSIILAKGLGIEVSFIGGDGEYLDFSNPSHFTRFISI